MWEMSQHKAAQAGQGATEVCEHAPETLSPHNTLNLAAAPVEPATATVP